MSHGETEQGKRRENSPKTRPRKERKKNKRGKETGEDIMARYSLSEIVCVCVVGESPDELLDEFFETEVELERKICRDVVCTSNKDEEGDTHTHTRTW